MNRKIVKIDKTDNYRLVVISDIHAHRDIFCRLIKKVNLQDEDYLIIIGDFVNRGIDSYEMYQVIKELSKRKNTIILKGNHESFMQRHLNKNEYTEEFFEFLKAEYYETLIGTIINKAGKSIKELTNSMDMLMYLDSERDELISFLRSLPIILYFDDMRFVHGGYDKEFCIENDETKYLKYDNYNELAKPNDITTIVGHWPASELRSDRLTNLPYINNKKNIVFIDGGLGVKHTGELNAFIIEKKNGQTNYECIQENNFEKYQVNRTHKFDIENLVYLNYPNNEFEVVKKGNQWSKCRHTESGKEFGIFSELLIENENGFSTKTNYINNFLNLENGTVIELCKVFDECALVKHEDEFGWLMKYQISKIGE